MRIRLTQDDHVVPKGSISGWQFPMFVCPPGPDHDAVWAANDIRVACPVHGTERMVVVGP